MSPSSPSDALTATTCADTARTVSDRASKLLRVAERMRAIEPRARFLVDALAALEEGHEKMAPVVRAQLLDFAERCIALMRDVDAVKDGEPTAELVLLHNELALLAGTTDEALPKALARLEVEHHREVAGAILDLVGFCGWAGALRDELAPRCAAALERMREPS
jgi:hypothetical protein